MNDKKTESISREYEKPMEPDFDWVAGKIRAKLPPMRLRAIPLIGILAGIASGFIMLNFMPELFIGFSRAPISPLNIIFYGGLIGFFAGIVIYQVLAHRAQRLTNVKE